LLFGIHDFISLLGIYCYRLHQHIQLIYLILKFRFFILSLVFLIIIFQDVSILHLNTLSHVCRNLRQLYEFDNIQAYWCIHVG